MRPKYTPALTNGHVDWQSRGTFRFGTQIVRVCRSSRVKGPGNTYDLELTPCEYQAKGCEYSRCDTKCRKVANVDVVFHNQQEATQQKGLSHLYCSSIRRYSRVPDTTNDASDGHVHSSHLPPI
jgi:hypothetical protein